MTGPKRGLPFFLRARGLLVLDLACLLGLLWVGFECRYGAASRDAPVQTLRMAVLLLMPLRVFLYALLGLYRTDLEETLLDLLYRVFWVCLIISGLEGLILLALRNYWIVEMGVSRKLLVFLWTAWAGAALFIRWVTGRLRQRLRDKEVRMVVVGAGRVDPVLYAEIGELARQGGVVGFAGDELELPDQRFPILGTLAELPEVLGSVQARQVIVIDERVARERLSWLLGHCEARGVTLRILPSLYEVMVGRVRVTGAGDIPLVEVVADPMTPVYRLLKRAVDLSLALAALLWVFWLGLLIGLLIKLDDSRGPVLERVPCTGWRGKRFDLLRFRTTAAGSSTASAALSLTPIGDILRRLDLDRIPQLLNVVVGNLSLVGPRPMTPDFLQAILREEPLYRHCLTVKPGVTGLAQVHGQRHHLRSKLRYDLSYINNCSLLLDLKILFQSFSVLMTGRKIRA